jgi:uncharacterized protein
MRTGLHGAREPCRILIFAKAPVPGETKTRLAPTLGAHGAALLQQRLIEHTLATARAAPDTELELYCAPDIRHSLFQTYASLGVPVKSQIGADLGERMAHALECALSERPAALLIGTDCPCLSPDYLHRAWISLSERVPVVMGPAEDGGYGLVGVAGSVPKIFSGIRWGSAQVMQRTRAKLRDLGIDWSELPALWDIDRPEDIERLRAITELAPLLAGISPAKIRVTARELNNNTCRPI